MEKKTSAIYVEQNPANNKRENELKQGKKSSMEKKSSSCFELNRITRIDRQESLLNVRRTLKNICGDDQYMRQQYRSSSEH